MTFFFNIRFLGFKFIPHLRHKNWLSTSFWTLSLGFMLITLDVPVPEFVEIVSSSDVANQSRLECLEKERQSCPSSSHLTNEADITCHLF
jgi:hypothetical protein